MEIVSQEIAINWKEDTSERKEYIKIEEEMIKSGFRFVWSKPIYELGKTVLRFERLYI
jgi:hypothetical protein